MLTMGLALLIFVLKSVYMRNGNDLYNKSARFWAKIFAVTFVMGVVTGIPLEFQFGTNWAAFSRFAGDIIAQTLAMEGAFAFFLESAFLGLRLLHHHDERLGTAPRRLQDPRERQHRARQLLGGSAQLVDLRAVRAQHGRCSGVWGLCDGWPRGLLRARPQE